MQTGTEIFISSDIYQNHYPTAQVLGKHSSQGLEKTTEDDIHSRSA